MRFVDLAFVKPPVEFKPKAAKAKAAGRQNINKHSDVWQCCKKKLRKASYKKCFYCETKTVRADGAVDHFRPKSHYHWSAFDFGNYRFACTFCNSRRADRETGITAGKGDAFPLFDDGKRAKSKAGEALEVPLLLDPCVAGDSDFLDFEKDGFAVPTCAEGDDKFNNLRAEQSIEYYHLNESELLEARLEHAVTLLEKVVDAEDAQIRMRAGEVGAQRAYSSAVRELKRAISPHAELSKFSNRTVQGYKNKKLVDVIVAGA